MNLVTIQHTARRGWVITYNGKQVAGQPPGLTVDGPARRIDSLLDCWEWLGRNPEGWAHDVTVQIVGSLAGVLGVE